MNLALRTSRVQRFRPRLRRVGLTHLLPTFHAGTAPRRPPAIAGLLAFLLMAATASPPHDRLGDAVLTGGDPAAVAWRVGQGGAGWLLGLAAGALVLRRAPGGATGKPRDRGPWFDWAREGVLPVYMLHQTVAVVLAGWILSWPLAGGLQWLVLTVLTVTCTLALYGVLRRVRLARLLMGMWVKSGARVPSG